MGMTKCLFRIAHEKIDAIQVFPAGEIYIGSKSELGDGVRSLTRNFIARKWLVWEEKDVTGNVREDGAGIEYV